MRLIPLTRGYSAIVDDADYKFLMRWKWYAARQPMTFYAARSTKKKGKKVTVWMHRVINKTPRGKLTDHIDGNGLNNHRRNLRAVTHQDNMLNNTRHKIGSSRYRGVSWHRGLQRWIAQITFNRKNTWIGSFRTEKAASDAYVAKRARLLKGKILKN